MKKHIPLIIFLILTLLCIGFIFANSAKNGEESGEESSGVVEFVEEIFENVGVDVDISEHFVRKLAHFSEYMLLSLLLCADIYFIISSRLGDLRTFLFFLTAPALSFATANVDEFVIQASTPGRGPSFKDVCIDTSGAIVGAIVFALAVYIILKCKKSKA